ncbi:MAG: XRE family transcriptional regulator [Victivallales bacterium]|jgi:transcriptional regulator with XRE-family HTH domain
MNVNVVIRKLRKQKKITLDRLAGLTGLTKGYLSKIERAPKAPPFSTLEVIARALGVDISFLLEQGKTGIENKNLDIMRRREWTPMEIDPGNYRDGCAFIPLLHSHQGKYMFPVLVTIEPGGKTEFQHDAEEFVYVLKGGATLTYDGETCELRKNDSFYLDSRRKHCFSNPGATPAILLSVYYSYRRF